MDELIEITLDLCDCEYIRDFHERVRVAFDFPEWYGKNPDALWDLLSEPLSAKVTVIGVDTMTKELREYFLKVIQVFEDVKTAQRELGLTFDYKILSTVEVLLNQIEHRLLVTLNLLAKRLIAI